MVSPFIRRILARHVGLCLHHHASGLRRLAWRSAWRLAWWLALAWPVATAGFALPARVGRPGGVHGTVNGRQPGYLGIEFHDAPAVPAGPLPVGTVRGVEVVMVDHDGPAGKAGLRPHDILVSLNGQTITSAEALRHLIHDAGAGMQVALNVVRNGRPLTLSAQLATRDEVDRAAMAHLTVSNAASFPPSDNTADNEVASEPTANSEASPAAAAAAMPATASAVPPVPHSQGFLSSMLHSGSSTGLMLDVLEPQLALYFGAPQGTGLLVQSVASGSIAAQAGLRAGDVLLRADAVTLRRETDWTKRLRAAKGRPVTLVVLRERREMTVALDTNLKHHSLLEWPAKF